MEAATHYRIDPSKLTFKELLREAHGRAFGKAWIARRLGIEPREPSPLPGPMLAKGRSSDPASLPPEAAARLLPLVEAARGLGFQTPWFVRHCNELALFPDFFALLRHGSGNAAVKFWTGDGDGPAAALFITPLVPEGWAVSGNRREWLPPQPPGTHRFLLPGADVERLWDFHKVKVAQLRDAVPLPLGDDTRLAGFCDAMETACFEWRLGRGVLVALTPEETATARRRLEEARETLKRFGAYGEVHRPVFMALDELAKRNSGWLPGVSLALLLFLGFVATGFARPDDPWFLGRLAGVMLFHEAGHWLAMWRTGFQDPGVFLFPWPGRPRSCAGESEKAWIAMMGPLPGLVAGTAILSFAIASHAAPWVFQLGGLFLCLNLLTLLPVFSSDGRRFLEAVLFSRHRWLQPACQAVVGGSLIAAGWNLGSLLLALAGIAALTPFPMTVRFTRLAHALRGRFSAPDGHCADEIEPKTAMLILKAMKRMKATAKPQKQGASLETAASIRKIHAMATAGRLPATHSAGWMAAYALALLLPLIPGFLYVSRSPQMNELARIGELPLRRPASVAERKPEPPPPPSGTLVRQAVSSRPPVPPPIRPLIFPEQERYPADRELLKWEPGREGKPEKMANGWNPGAR